MGEDSPPSTDSFDLDALKQLIEMMESHGLTEISLKQGDQQWRLRRGHETSVAPVPVAPTSAAPAPVAPAAAATPSPSASTPTAEPEGRFILCPTVGTFYSAPSPDDPPFVKPGDEVKPETVVCLVEAMKTFNQIPAELSGTIAEVLVKNGDAVDVNTKLFRVT